MLPPRPFTSLDSSTMHTNFLEASSTICMRELCETGNQLLQLVLLPQGKRQRAAEACQHMYRCRHCTLR